VDTDTVKRVLVTGSRDWTDEHAIFVALAAWWEKLGREPGTLLVHGDCPTGADAIADRIWRGWGLPVMPRPALWGVWGKKAGPLRNKHMVYDIGANVCLAFIMPGSRGAVGCAKLADEALIDTRRFTP
jgi:hypothetical protein